MKTVLDGIQVAGSLVGTWQDLKEAFDLATDGDIKPIVSTCKLEEVNKMKKGEIKGRKVVKF